MQPLQSPQSGHLDQSGSSQNQVNPTMVEKLPHLDRIVNYHDNHNCEDFTGRKKRMRGSKFQHSCFKQICSPNVSLFVQKKLNLHKSKYISSQNCICSEKPGCSEMSKSWTESIWCLAAVWQQPVNEWGNNMLTVMRMLIT